MRMFRFSIGWALGAVIALIAAFPTFAAEYAGRAIHLTMGTDFGASRAEFDAELAHHRKTRTAHVDLVNSDLTRDGHGFRQASALARLLGEPTPREVAIC